MLLVLESDKAKTVLDNYFTMLTNTGYVKRSAVKRYLTWLFLLDFVELVYDHLTNEDYTKINNALLCLFSNGCCLMPYNVVSAPKYGSVAINKDIYLGSFDIRITEQEQWRIAEDSETFRIA